MAHVILVSYTPEPYNLSVASARTCYSSRGILYPEDMTKDEKALALRDKVARSTLEAGHLTTRQHPHFVFAIDKVSRLATWSFLHSHPFYNSEQVSQRYVEVKPDQFYIPKSLYRNENLLNLYKEIILFQMETYKELIQKIFPYAEKEYFRTFPYREKNKEKWHSQIHRRSIEIARYILPLATYTYLYHTINGLTLHRYRRMVNVSDVPEEVKEIVEAMWQRVYEIDPLFAKEIKDPVPLEETLEFKIFSEFSIEFSYPSFLFSEDIPNYGSKLIGWNENTHEILKKSISLFFSNNSIPYEKIIGFLLSPEKNPHLSSNLQEYLHSRVFQVFRHMYFTFEKKLSHTADSQNQRHRTTLATRPYLMHYYTGKPDYITPSLIKENDDLFSFYVSKMEMLFEKINHFLDSGAGKEEAVYLLPNAYPVRLVESGDFLGFYHKWKTRSCYNAQEEIFTITLQEIKQVEEKFPFLSGFLAPPCKLRKLAKITPYCPEGDRFCGIPVWDMTLEESIRVF